MAEKTILCICIACLKANPNGVLLIQNTYNRHRRKQQELSEREQHSEDFESRTGDIQQREDFVVNINEGNQGENLAEDVMDESQGGNLNLVGLDEDNSNLQFEPRLICDILLEDSDAESFSFNEEDMNINSVIVVEKMVMGFEERRVGEEGWI